MGIMRELENAEHNFEKLQQENADLQTRLFNKTRSLQQCEEQCDKMTRGKTSAENERDRSLSDVCQLRGQLSQEKNTVAQLQRELCDANAARSSVEAWLSQSTTELAEAHCLIESLEKTKATQKRLLHGMRSLACAECRIRSREMEGIREFFVDEAPKPKSGIA